MQHCKYYWIGANSIKLSSNRESSNIWSNIWSNQNWHKCWSNYLISGSMGINRDAHKYNLMFFINLVVYTNYPEKKLSIYVITPWKLQHLHMNFFSLKIFLTLNYFLGYFQVLLYMWFIWFSTFSNLIKLAIESKKKSELNSDSIPFYFF